MIKMVKNIKPNIKWCIWYTESLIINDKQYIYYVEQMILCRYNVNILWWRESVMRNRRWNIGFEKMLRNVVRWNK